MQLRCSYDLIFFLRLCLTWLLCNTIEPVLLGTGKGDVLLRNRNESVRFVDLVRRS